MHTQPALFSKHRIEALSDGVFAIAMTLLVLDLKVPLDIQPGHLAQALAHDFSEWISFAVSFALLALYWTFQHRVFELLERVGSASLALTFLFLGLVSVLPFSTSLWGHHIREPLAFSIYYVNQFLMAVALLAKLELARVRHHLGPTAELAALRLRLYFLGLAMLVAAATFWVLPLKFAYIPLVVVALAGRAWRFRQSRQERHQLPLASDPPA